MLLRRIAVLMLVLAAALPGVDSRADDFTDARQLHRSGQPGAALQRLELHLEKQPRDARARFLKGVILSEENRRAEAIEVFQSLTEDFPELSEPYNNLAALLAAQGSYDRAREALQMAIRTNPDYPTARENLGDIYVALAREQYEKVAVLDQKNETARTKLALIKELLPAAAGASAVAPEPVPNAAAAADERASTAAAPQPAAVAEPPAPPPPSPPPALSAESEVVTADSRAPVQDPTQAVVRTVEDWAAAWSMQDADRYLSFYAPDFRTPKGEPRDRWEAARRDDLAKSRNISVRVSDPKVTFRDESHASVVFRQDYASASTKRTGRKTLEMVRAGERWLIQRETLSPR